MPTFDGENLLIILDSGQTEVNIESDLYSRWKDWLLEDSNNRKFPQAFRTVGGDALTPGINAGAYFFLQNDKGWRIKPSEEDATIFITGNLAAEDSSIPILIPTSGEFSVLVAGLQPITQSVEDILVQGQVAEYGGVVVVDFLFGSSGTAYPIGLSSNPVDNVVDAFTIANRIGSRTFEIRNGNFILDRNTISYTYVEGGGQGSVDPNGYDVGGSKFLGVNLLNSNFAGTTSGVRVIGSNLIEIRDFRGVAENCGIIGTVTLQPALCSFDKCFSLNLTGGENGEARFDPQSGNTNLNITAWSGTLDLINTVSGFTSDINITSGEIHFYDSCGGGICNLRGIGDITDDSTGIIINRNGFIEGEDILQLKEFVFIDTINGEAGLTENVGTSIRPVNNLQDAYTLSVKRNLKKFKIKTSKNNIDPLVLDRNYNNYTFEGTVGKFSAVINLNGQSVDEGIFNNVRIIGHGEGKIIGRELDVVNASGVTGLFENCGINSLYITKDDSEILLIDCYSNVAGSGHPPFYVNSYSGLSLQARKYSGSLGIYGSTSPSNSISFDVSSGRLILDSSSTAGDLIARGVGYILDLTNGNGINIDRSGFINGDDIIKLRNFIYIDLVDGVSGTSENVGTIDLPVNNLQDAYTLSVKRNLKKFKIKTLKELLSPIILDRSYDGYTFEGTVGRFTAVIDLNGQSVDGATFKNLTLVGEGIGDIDGNSLDVINTSGITGVFELCGIISMTITRDDSKIVLVDCYSNVSGSGHPPFNVNGYSGLSFQARGYKGSLGIYNATSPDNTYSFDVSSGRLILDSSSTDGDLIARGVGSLLNNSTMTVNKEGFLEAKLLEELHRLQGLNNSAPMTVTKTSRVAGDINLTISGDGNTTSTVTRI